MAGSKGQGFLPFSGCVTLGKSLHLSVLICWIGIMAVLTLLADCEEAAEVQDTYSEQVTRQALNSMYCD